MEHPDVIMLENSMIDGDSPKPCVEKSILYVNDSNAQAYNGQITIDSTQFSTSTRWIDYSEAAIEIPLVISLKSSIDISAVAHSFMTTLKAGSWNLIESLQVEFSNRNVQQSVSFSNFAYNYRVLSQWSEEDMQKYGDLCNFWLDSEASTTRSSSPSTSGEGFMNNVAYAQKSVFTSVAPLQAHNEGFRRRLEQTGVGSTGNGGVSRNAADMQQSGVSYWVQTGAGASAVYNTYVICTIRLKDVSDLFAKMPLTKGLQARFTIRYNSARAVLTCVAATEVMNQSSVSILSGNTCPFMISSAEATTGPMNLVLDAGDQTITIENGVFRTSLAPTNTHPALTSARLYVPSYVLNADAERDYVTSDPIKTIQYEDIYQYIITDVAANSGQINSLISNGIINPTKLVMIPYVSDLTLTDGVQQYHSVFDSAPVTGAPGVTLNNLQVMLAGKAIYDQPISYSWEQFLYENSKSGIDGGRVTGLTSGLFSKLGYDHSYPYIVVDLSRRYSQQDILSKSIQVTAQNGSPYKVSLLCFVFYKRTISIETSSGKVM
jgi:hypothetical protein